MVGLKPFNSGSGRRRGSWRERSEDEWYWLTCSAGKNCANFEFEFESAELERGGKGGRCDRRCSDADSDAHAVGYAVTNGVNAGEHELFKPNCDVQQASYASDGWTRENCWEACRGITVELGVHLAMFDVEWWRPLASSGT